MQPAFGDEWKRKINLGGVSSATTPATILSRVQAERQARAEHKRRVEGATTIQAWYRGTLQARKTRAQMKSLFATDVGGLTGLRCLVLIGRDDEVLSRWAETILGLGPEAVLRPAVGANGQSWLVLMRKACVLLMSSVQAAPESDNARKYMRILAILLSHDTYLNVLGKDHGTPVCVELTRYVLQHNYYDMLRSALDLIPVSSKSSPSIPPLLQLVTLPLSTFPPSSPDHTAISTSIFSSILALPLLPNRLPLDILSHFVAQLPIKRLDDLAPIIGEIVQKLTASGKIHLTANLFTIVSPNYKSLSPAALGTYLDIQVLLLNSFHDKLFKEKEKKGVKGKKRARLYAQEDEGHSDSDSEGPSTHVAVVQSFDAPAPALTPPKIDDKTKNRLQKLISATHLTSLITATQSKMPFPPSSSPDSIFHKLVGFLFALTAAWPRSESATIWNTILAVSGGAGLGLVGALYRTAVRSSPLNKRRDDEPTSVFDPKNASYWTPLLLFCDLYSQALLTMGDDEFFGPSQPAARGANPGTRNPLVLDELIELSRLLLDVAFEVYWRGGGAGMVGDSNTSGVPVMGEFISPRVRCTWDAAREKVTKCLVGIHARDSRKPFVPPGHWLITSQLDMNSFVEAAVLEDQQLNSSNDTPPSSSHHLPLSKRNHRHHNQLYLASLSPRLAILNNIPFAIPFETRVSIFRHFVLGDKVARASRGMGGMGMMGMFGHSTRPRVMVRREMVAQDGFDRLSEVDLKGPVEITFVDQWGNEEAGIDGGGVFKEFFTSLCREVFDTDRGLWLANTKRELYPNPHAYATEPHSLNWYRFIGRILGKAMYEGILVDVAFAGFFLAKWLGRQSFLDDLFSLDPELYKGLIYLKHYKGNPEDLSLNFTVAIDEFGEAKSVDLIPNGSNIAVTSENRLTYIYLVSHYRLSKQIKLQSNAFFEGLSDMIDSKWIRMFNQQEVQILIGGVNSPIDLDDLRNHTNYGGLYDNHHPTIIAFWHVVNSFDQEQRRALLRFVTSCSRPPLLGFKELNPNFSIRDAGSDQHRLPTSSTCVNLLKLPSYDSERTLKEKLLQAIFSGAGFDLS